MHAVIDPAAGYSEALSMPLTQLGNTADTQYGPDIDNGHTKANALYWASTRTSGGGGGATSTSTALSASPSTTAVQGVSVTLTATITPSAAAGTVTFKNGGSTLGTGMVSGGVATLATSALPVGSLTLTAEFASSNTGAYTNSTSSGLSYTVTASGGGGGGSTGSNANAVPYLALSTGQPNTAVRRGVADTNYTIVGSDAIIGYTSLTASRTVTLPAASTVPVGKQFIVKDESGSCASGVTITISGTVDGVTNIILNSAYAKAILYSNGTNWYRISV